MLYILEKVYTLNLSRGSSPLPAGRHKMCQKRSLFFKTLYVESKLTALQHQVRHDRSEFLECLDFQSNSTLKD